MPLATPRAFRALVLGAVLLGMGCAPTVAVQGNDTPEWLAALIRQMEREPVANPPGYVARYTYQGREVYYVPPRCCDVPSTLYTAEGTVLCQPDGGFTGRGDGRCPGFLQERKDERIIWRDSRG